VSALIFLTPADSTTARHWVNWRSALPIPLWNPASNSTCCYAFNRKEAKDHGEGGAIVGAPLAGKVLVIDDVISAGTSVRESIAIIRDAGATTAGIAIALDRQERGSGELSASQQVNIEYGVPCISIATLDDLIRYLGSKSNEDMNLNAIEKYRENYGIKA
jgi:orotate phosphoribosyltransferase